MSRDKDVLLKEANHVMTVCNACRYCEGFCAVFPAMELRRIFTVGDMKYFAHLCHNCRGCYYACQYAPPHEFNLNIPKTFAELRLELYKEFAWPGFMKSLLERNGRTITILSITCVLFVFLLTLFSQGAATLFGVHTEAGAFYEITPYLWVMIPFSLIAIGVLCIWAKGVLTFWKAIGAPLSDLFELSAHIQAVKDMLALRYLGGGGHGCNYPDDAFSMTRRYFHHFVFYGFLMCFAATCIAFFYEHALGWMSPYGVTSLPVIFGLAGGVSICIGTVGLYFLKNKMDPAPSSPLTSGMDRSFIILVFLTSASGLLVLFFRSTSAMGFFLTVHLGFVLAFFLTAPYGKMLHALYRYFALVRNAQEQARADAGDSAGGH